MPDSVRVTSRESWGSRLMSSIKGILFGGALFLVSFPLLFWNEGRAVKTARSLEEGAGLVVPVTPDSVDVAHEGRLVHVNGFAKTDETLVDETFGVSENAVKLTRRVEMFQWVESTSSESETKLGGSKETTTTYEYDREWRSDLLDSSKFRTTRGHENPAAFPYESKTLSASKVALGAFELSSSQIDQLGKSESVSVQSPPAGIESVHITDGVFFIGNDPQTPNVGDVRVSFRAVRPGAVSIVARQIGNTFEPYHAEAGGNVFLLEESIVSADAMFESAQASNVMMTWILRAVGFVLMFVGLSMVFQPIAVFGDVVPIVGRLLGTGIGLVAGLIAACLSLVTIAIAWLAYRPLLGVALLALGVGAAVLLAKMSGKRKGGAPTLPPIPHSEPR